MTTGGLNTPLHHHQQHHLQMQQHQQGYSSGGHQGILPSGAPQQQQQRRGSGGNAGRGPQTTGQQHQQYGYPAYPGAVPQQQQPPPQDADFALDLQRIGDDVETRTTVMVSTRAKCWMFTLNVNFVRSPSVFVLAG